MINKKKLLIKLIVIKINNSFHYILMQKVEKLILIHRTELIISLLKLKTFLNK